MTTKLFTTKQVKTWFNLFSDKERHQTKRYKGYDNSNPDRTLCEQEVFIKKTLKKWFSGKYLVLYQVNEITGVQYKNYLFIGGIVHSLGWNDEVTVYALDYSSLNQGWQQLKITHNKALRLEGYFCDNDEQHLAVAKLFSIEDLPERSFSYEAYDWSKFQSRGRGTKEQKLEKIKTTVTVSAKTEYEAGQKIEKMQKENKDLMIRL